MTAKLDWNRQFNGSYLSAGIVLAKAETWLLEPPSGAGVTSAPPPQPRPVVAVRGLSAGCGCSTVARALAVALAVDDPAGAAALAGDLSLLHDVNGLLADPQPDLTIVVVNNDGGGIFSLLPQAAADDDSTFERLFGTPHGVDLARLAAAYGVGHLHVRTTDDLAAQLGTPASGIRLLEVRTERNANAELHRRLRAVAAEALSG